MFACFLKIESHSSRRLQKRGSSAMIMIKEINTSNLQEREMTSVLNLFQTALELGNRTLMMDGGHIIFDTEGEERAKLTVPDLLVLFKTASGRELNNDRMMLS